jgi:asparagine synthase (glutamine-hydrolysing)
MCGIAAIVTTDGHQLESRIDDLRGWMHHRGPDSAGTTVRALSDVRVALGSQRLSILDLSPDGSMPMCNEDGTVWITYNGEIYNHEILRSELECKGHRYRSHTDTETVIHAYEEHGTDCFARFNGMFACVIVDEEAQRVVFARDRMGIKPLYFAKTPEGLVISSELRALVKAGIVPFEIDQRALDVYLGLGYVPAPLCLVKGVTKLEAGAFAVLTGNDLRMETFWEPKLTRAVQRTRKWKCAVDLTRSALEDAVRDQLMSDVPVGVLLSGGLDSSFVGAIAARTTTKPLHTFSIGFKVGDPVLDDHYNKDRTYAARLAKELGTIHHDVIVESDDALEAAWKRAVGRIDEPTWEPSFISILLMSELARENNVKVVLTGDGSDELFAGYSWFANMQQIEPLRRIPGARYAIRSISSLPVPQHFKDRTRLLAGTLAKTEAEQFADLHSIFDREFRSRAFARPRNADPILPMAQIALERAASVDLGSRVGLAELQWWVMNHFNQRVDRMTMAASVEGRVPFQDNRVVEAAFSIPPSAKRKDGVGKAVLRAAARGIVPPYILERRKVAFSAPVGYLVSSKGCLFPWIVWATGESAWRNLPGIDPVTLEAIRCEFAFPEREPHPRFDKQSLSIINLLKWAESFNT